MRACLVLSFLPLLLPARLKKIFGGASGGGGGGAGGGDVSAKDGQAEVFSITTVDCDHLSPLRFEIHKKRQGLEIVKEAFWKTAMEQHCS